MLVSMKELLQPTRQHGFAIGAFNVADNCFLRAVVDEAEATNTPAIIAIHPSEHDFVGDAFFAHVREITQRSPVPFVLHLDHGASVEHVLRAIRCGFTSVMIDGSLLPYEENVALTAEVVRLAHAVGVSVEGELGTIGQTGTSVEGGVSQVTYTDPAQAADFIARTGADTLAVAIGTAHGLYSKTPKIDFQRLAEIREVVDVPLVLHGASDVPDEFVRRTIELGVTKVNVATELKIAFAGAVKAWFAENPQGNDPRYYMRVGMDAMKEVVRNKINVCGSANRISA